MININIPSKIRNILYIFTALGSIIVAYLSATQVISSNEVAAWTAFTAFIAGLAKLNITPDN